MVTSSIILAAGVAGGAVCQFPPKPEGVTVLKSRFHENVTISHKEPGICETTPGVKSYAGYVHLPPGFLEDAIGEPQDYPINTFFWFFEARKNPSTAPLTIWLNGGPGGSSLMGLPEENGPCYITSDSKSTTLNPWSWNNELTYESHLHEWRRLGGNKDRLDACRVALDEGIETPEACLKFFEYFLATTDQDIADANVGGYNIAHPTADPFPLPHLHGYLMEESVLAALGVPVNYSSVSMTVNQVFNSGTFDVLRPGFMESIGKLLDGGVKVHMVYGDRDWACNWFGGETASLEIPHSRKSNFASAGYTPSLPPLSSPNTVPFGLTRQSSNLGAGHEVPSYQPQAAYEIFMRATLNKDIATGLLPVTEDPKTEGPSDVRGIKNGKPEKVEPRCYILKISSCTEDVWTAVVNGTAVVRDWWVVGFEGEGGDGERKDL